MNVNVVIKKRRFGLLPQRFSVESEASKVVAKATEGVAKARSEGLKQFDLWADLEGSKAADSQDAIKALVMSQLKAKGLKVIDLYDPKSAGDSFEIGISDNGGLDGSMKLRIGL